MKHEDFNFHQHGFVGHLAEPDAGSDRAVIVIMGGEQSLLSGIKFAERFADYGIMGLAVSLFGLGFLLYLVCAIGIRNGAVGMIYLYEQTVQNRAVELGMTTEEEINKQSLLFKAVCIPGYMIYVLVCVYALNGARGFWPGFWQAFVILSVMNLIDRFLIDEYWVGHTKAWIIPGTEDLRPYITARDKQRKWIMGTVGMAVIAAALSGIMCLIL